ncbi:uncharacterized protein LOC123686186 [Harmonia axyridis]|uniref:uncharacterized protein LOC123686186 n=1 Tax=Harmonia axyridis TaxID=115357 RepID=UPI001E27807B|nr:uncharacterized protein LOC123686186 [Harmonia axyridis]
MVEKIKLDWTEESQEFQSPKRTCKHPNQLTQDPSNIATTNRFGILNVEAMETDTSALPDVAPENGKKMKICLPIIVISKIEDCRKFHNMLKKIVTNDNFTIRYYADETKIFINNHVDYTNLRKSFKVDDIKFYSFSPKEEKKKKIVVKAASFTSEEEIKERILSDYNMKSDDVSCLKMKGKNGQSHSFLVSVPKTTNLKELTKTKELDHIKLEWQRYSKKSKAPQCFRCQRFGHGSSNCLYI